MDPRRERPTNTRLRHGGRFERIELNDQLPSVLVRAFDEDVLTLNESHEDLERVDAQAANLVNLR